MRSLSLAIAGACALALLAGRGPQAHAVPEAPPAGDAADPSLPVPAIVLYTMGKGEVVWEKFGHAAICEEYPPRSGHQSICYNYGTTDFGAPISVGWGFLRGQGRFWVSRTTPQHMIQRYSEFNRDIFRQVLPLSREQALAIAAKLHHDWLPENRYYNYHHFYDNCTTRIRDIIDTATGGALKRDSASKPGPTFRGFSRQGFAEDAWLLLLTDYMLGHGADVQPDLWQAMFLPWYLREQVRERLGAEPELIYERQGRPFATEPASTRGWLLLLGLLMALPVAITRYTGRNERAGIAAAAVPLFLIALVIWFMAVITTVKEFRYNEALLIHWPTDIALPFMGPERRRRYAQVRIAVLALVSLLLAVGVFSQPLWVPMIVVFLPMIFIAVPPRARSAALPDHSSEHMPESMPKPTHSKKKVAKQPGRARKGAARPKAKARK